MSFNINLKTNETARLLYIADKQIKFFENILEETANNSIDQFYARKPYRSLNKRAIWSMISRLYQAEQNNIEVWKKTLYYDFENYSYENARKIVASAMDMGIVETVHTRGTLIIRLTDLGRGIIEKSSKYFIENFREEFGTFTKFTDN